MTGVHSGLSRQDRLQIQACMDLAVLVEALRLARMSREEVAQHLEGVRDRAVYLAESIALGDLIRELRAGRMPREQVAQRLQKVMAKLEPL